MSFVSDPKIPTIKKKHINMIIEEIDEGIDAAFEEVVEKIKSNFLY